MRAFLSLVCFLLLFSSGLYAQESFEKEEYEKHGVVWTAGLFKSWLEDRSVGFDKVGDIVTPVFDVKKKMGFSVTSHYMYKPSKWLGIGIHLGMGLDVNSYVAAPVLLFGPSISFGKKHQFILDFGWADAKRKIVPGRLRDQLLNETYVEIPEIYNYTETNTGYYLGLGYRFY
ncbi:MAG: hypothetical protein AAGA77_17975 [Bacteroidota bacterium]